MKRRSIVINTVNVIVSFSFGFGLSFAQEHRAHSLSSHMKLCLLSKKISVLNSLADKVAFFNKSFFDILDEVALFAMNNVAFFVADDVSFFVADMLWNLTLLGGF